MGIFTLEETLIQGINSLERRNINRRKFIVTSLPAVAGTYTIANASLLSSAMGSLIKDVIPWYRRVKRWRQINITENNAANFDIEWWWKCWKRTETHGIVLNAGGIVLTGFLLKTNSSFALCH